ncbi:hypothetical protein [Hyalangium gracile]|uniref:hypothetical protein n=1 Tax=Hyalangium gracile TaxID=394092 RepID=UPI001CCFA1FC|nr:hypothetical protein [Hyalangium gracile]
MANPDAFDRDFGYLMPFLDKVAAAATELEDPAARDELSRILSEEKVRWNRVRELLRGAAGGKGTPSRPASAPAQTLARSSADGINRVAPLMTGLTVGSLKNSR